jgi:hypothetical protein
LLFRLITVNRRIVHDTVFRDAGLLGYGFPVLFLADFRAVAELAAAAAALERGFGGFELIAVRAFEGDLRQYSKAKAFKLLFRGRVDDVEWRRCCSD